MKAKDWNIVAPCGLYCGECTGLLDGECGGCRSNKGLSSKYQKYCKIYKCATSKNLKICLDCESFPCKFFDFFKAETLESSAWFLDILCNMKRVKEHGISKFLRAKEKWLAKRRACASKRGINYCNECKQWPCGLLKREVLIPMDLQKFKDFMS
ncbi:MAG: DUF3795 domain-containing protein, partial [Candidatus Bathyarchaeia archaeon]